MRGAKLGNQNGLIHGHTINGRSSPTYSTWANMIQRCTNPNKTSYEHYGGRGITVCERWTKFKNFLEDVGEKPDGLSLDRIDNDGGYEPRNYHWATLKQQAYNHRHCPSCTCKLTGDEFRIA